MRTRVRLGAASVQARVVSARAGGHGRRAETCRRSRASVSSQTRAAGGGRRAAGGAYCLRRRGRRGAAGPGRWRRRLGRLGAVLESCRSPPARVRLEQRRASGPARRTAAARGSARGGAKPRRTAPARRGSTCSVSQPARSTPGWSVRRVAARSGSLLQRVLQRRLRLHTMHTGLHAPREARAAQIGAGELLCAQQGLDPRAAGPALAGLRGPAGQSRTELVTFGQTDQSHTRASSAQREEACGYARLR